MANESSLPYYVFAKRCDSLAAQAKDPEIRCAYAHAAINYLTASQMHIQGEFEARDNLLNIAGALENMARTLTTLRSPDQPSPRSSAA